MAGVTSSSTLSGQFRNHFRKQLLKWTEQLLVLNQFAQKLPVKVPKNGGGKGITAFRFGNPAINDVQALTEGTVPANSTARQLSLSSISKSLTQFGEHTVLTDILTGTDLFDSSERAMKTIAKDMALHFELLTRNVLVGSNTTISGANMGTAQEGGGSLDNSDTLNENFITGADFAALNSSTTGNVNTAAFVLDNATELQINRAPLMDGKNYACVLGPQVARDLMRDTDWLEAKKYSDVKDLYNGEIGSLYGVRFAMHTVPFVATGSATNSDRFIYSTAGGNGTGTGKNIYTSLFLGAESFGVPALSGENPAEPDIIVAEGADKADPYNQLTTLAVKTYWTALRVNCNWYCIARTKTAFNV
jgi:N4-gp56 family major capsid protein